MIRTLLRKAAAVFLVSLLLCGCGKEQRAKRQADSAESYFRDGDYDRAEIVYKNVLRDSPRDTLAHERLGTIWLDRGDPLQAAHWLAKAKKLSPENLTIRVQLAKALFGLGATLESRAELRLVLKASPAHENAVLFLAETAESAEDLKETKEHLQKLSEEKSAPIRLAFALVALRQGNSAAGEAAVLEACELDPAYPFARALRASLLLSANDLTGAEAEFKAAAEKSPLRSPERLKLAAFLLQTGRKAEALSSLEDLTSKAADYLPAWRMQAQIALAEHRHDDAAKLLERVFSRAPTDLEAGLMQTEIWLTKGDGDKAVALMKRLQTAFPDRPGIEFHLGRAYLSVANQTLANEALERALKLDPSYSDAVLLRARLKLSLGEAEDVANAMESFLGEHPDDVQAQLLLVDAYRASGNLNAAEAVLKQSARTSGSDFRPHLFMGMILRSKGDNAAARKAFDDAQRLAPDNLLVTLQLAALDVVEQDLPSAKMRVDGQLARNPSSAGAHYLSAAVADEQRDWQQAEQALLRAIDLESDFLAAYGLLIRVYVEAGKMDEAAEQLRQFIAGNPDNVPALMQLGAIYQETGRNEEARDCYERINRLDSSFAPALNNLAILFAEALGQPDKAYEIATQARTLLPEEGAVADTLGWIVLKRKDYKRAFALLQEAAQALPDNPGVQYHLGVAAVNAGDALLARTSLERALGSGKNFSGKEEAARLLANLRQTEGIGIAEIERSLQADPDNVIIRISLGKALEAGGCHEEAAAAYLKALEINADLEVACIRLATLYGGVLKQPDKALEFAKRARQLAPHDPRAAASLGQVAFAAGNHPWAYSLLQEAAAGLPGDPRVLFDLGWAAYATGRIGEARAAMQRAASPAAAPDHAAEIRDFLTLSDPDFKDTAETRALLAAVLEKQPRHVPALMANTRLLELETEAGQAERVYREVLGIYPSFAPAAKRLAILCAKDPAKLEEAAAFGTRAREILTDDEELASVLARIKFQQRDFEVASRLLQDAGERRSLDAGELYLLGMALGELDRPAEARTALQKALDYGVGDSEASKAKAMLLRLKPN